MKLWLLRIIIGLDTWVGCMFRGGHIGETISARAATARADKHLWGVCMCSCLDWLEPDHCTNAVINDRIRAQAILDDLEGR